MSGRNSGLRDAEVQTCHHFIQFLKPSPFPAKKIAHWTNWGSMANPLLPKAPLPIMLAIVAFLFLLFPPIHVWFQAAGESFLQQKYWARDFNHHLIKRLCGKGKAILIRLTGWLRDALTIGPIRPRYGEAPLEPGLVWVGKKLIGNRYYMLICYLSKKGTRRISAQTSYGVGSVLAH